MLEKRKVKKNFKKGKKRYNKREFLEALGIFILVKEQAGKFKRNTKLKERAGEYEKRTIIELEAKLQDVVRTLKNRSEYYMNNQSCLKTVKHHIKKFNTSLQYPVTQITKEAREEILDLMEVFVNGVSLEIKDLLEKNNRIGAIRLGKKFKKYLKDNLSFKKVEIFEETISSLIQIPIIQEWEESEQDLIREIKELRTRKRVPKVYFPIIFKKLKDFYKESFVDSKIKPVERIRKRIKDRFYRLMKDRNRILDTSTLLDLFILADEFELDQDFQSAIEAYKEALDYIKTRCGYKDTSIITKLINEIYRCGAEIQKIEIIKLEEKAIVFIERGQIREARILLFQAQDLEKEIPEKFRDKKLLNQIRSLLNSLELNTASECIIKMINEVNE